MLLYALFSLESTEPLSSTISENAVQAAINFVELCCQQTAYIAGRENIEDELSMAASGNLNCINTCTCMELMDT